MLEAERILVLDQDNIGHDLDWAVFATFGELILRPRTGADEISSILNEHRPAIIVANRPIFSAEILALGARNGLGLICLTATGINTVDLAAARHNRIAICNIVGYSTDSVAQHTFALALELINRSAQLHERALSWHQRVGESPENPPPWTDLSRGIHELAGKTWGIIGLGTIGHKVASIAAAFGCRVIWASVGGMRRHEAWPQSNLEELLLESDIVSIHSPITDASRNLITRRQLSLMKPSALLINVGRGGIVNESDLAAVLQEGLIAGAGIDVLWPEPPLADNPLLAIPPNGRLLLTPHVAWAAVEARQRALAECAANITAWKQGLRRNRVD